MVSKSGTPVPTPPKALSLHIGLNAVNAVDYGGCDGPLAACEFDANDMAAIAKEKAMESTVLLTKKATRANVLAGLRSAAKLLSAGDLFFMTYSGHSGSVTHAPPPPPPPGQRIKPMPAAVAMRVYREHQAFYDQLQLDVAKAAGRASVDPDTALANVAANGRLSAIVKKFNPAALLISGCQDNQTSLDGDHNGAFTEQLLRVWSNCGFKGNYGILHARIKAAMPATQTPNLFTLGRAGAFLAQTPFTV